MGRRDVLRGAAAALGALATGSIGAETQPAGGSPAAGATRPAGATQPAGSLRFRASDTVTLGRSGIKTSRLAIGTGTSAGREQAGLGIDGLTRLLRHGLDEHGIRWWETADMYKTHSHVAAALKTVKRDQVVITTKTQSKDHAGVKADIERFRRELGTEYIDIVLLHCMENPAWPDKLRGAMDALSEAKAKGWVRAVGCSCHTLGALTAAANEPWVDVDLARLNPYAVEMDVKHAEETWKVTEQLEKMHRQGKGVYCMKILGAGTFKPESFDTSLRLVLSKPFAAGFTIGFSKAGQIDDIAGRIERTRL